MMNKISSCLKCRWLGGPSPGLCHATMTEVAPPVASVVRSTSMSRPKGLIDNACLGVTTAGCSGVRACMDVVSGSSRPFSSKRLASAEPQPCLRRQLRTISPKHAEPSPTQVLDTWHRDRRAVGPDRWLTAGLLRQRQPNRQVEAGSIKDLPCAEFGQTRLRHRAAQSQRVGGEPYCLETGCLAALPGGGGEHADQVVLRLEHQRDVSEIEPPRRFKKRGKQLRQTRFKVRIGHAVAFETIEIMCGDRSEIVRASNAPGEPDGVEEERPLPEGRLFTGEDLRLKKVAVLGRVLISAEQVAAA